MLSSVIVFVSSVRLLSCNANLPETRDDQLTSFESWGPEETSDTTSWDTAQISLQVEAIGPILDGI